MGQKGQRQLVRIEEPGGFSAMATTLDGTSLVEQDIIDNYSEILCRYFVEIFVYL